MAKLYGDIASSALMTFDKSFARANGQPLDSTEVYYSLAAAQEYAAGAGAYIGQKIVVIENGKITHYSIEDAAGSLKELGAKPVGDSKTVSVAADGTISLANIPETLKDEEGNDIPATYNAVLVNGQLTWVKPSATTVEGLSDLIEALTGRVDSAEVDIDTLQSAVGVAAKGAVGEEGSEDYEPAVAATGLFKAIADEIARATTAEEALGGRIDAIDFVDTDELAATLDPYATKQHVADEIGKIEIPVVGVATDDKILALGADKLISATVSLDYDSENKKIILTGKDGADLGSVDATPFIKDGMLNDVTYDVDSDTLTFKWNTDAGITENTIVLSDILEPYSAGNGLNLESNEFSIKVADGNESFLSVDENGIKLSGVQTAINTAKAEAISDAEGKIATAKAEAAQDATSKANQALADAKTDAANLYATKEFVGNFTTGEDDYKDIDTIVAYINKKAEETLSAAQGGSSETAASVALALQNYKNENDPKVSKNTEDIATINEKLNGIESDADVNVIEVVKVNGSALTPDELKAVDITVPTKFSDISDDSGFDARIIAAQSQADKGVNDALAAQTTANEAKAAAAQNNTAIGEINTTIAGHIENINDHAGRITALENYKTSHEAEYTTLNGIVSDHTSEIAKKASQTDLDSAVARIASNEAAIQTLNETTIPGINTEIGKKANSADVFTKTEVTAITGTPTEGKTLVQMISDAQSAATYDDTQVKADIKTNADAIALLKSEEVVEGSIKKIADDRIAAALAGADADFDTLKEMSDWLSGHKKSAAAMNSAIEDNTAAITKLNGTVETEGSVLSMIAENVKIATITTAGIVKASETENGIVVGEDGTMSVHSLNVNKLVQTETLVLNGGTANS
jgi:hypothetical protein